MSIAIMQPTYLPWLGYFDLIDQVDKFVFLDDVQLVKRSWQVRNKINSKNGEILLTIPIKRNNNKYETFLNNAQIDLSINWQKNHLKSIQNSYSKCKYFEEVFYELEHVINNKLNILSNFNINIIKIISHKLGINSNFINSSDINNKSGKKDDLLVSICTTLKSNLYISPIGSSEYIEREIPGGAFTKNSIKLFYQNYNHPVYKTIHPFRSHLGIIDLIFNNGFSRSLEIIREGRRELYTYEKLRTEILKLK